MFNRPIRAISILRLYVALSGVIVACVMVRLLDSSEHQGFQMGFLIALFSSLALADTMINDVFPESFVYEKVKRWRNVGFMVLAICYAGCLFFIAQYDKPPILLCARLVLDSILCAVISFAGLTEVAEEEGAKPRSRKPMA